MSTTQLDVKHIGEQVKAASAPFRRLQEEMHRVIVGQDELLHGMLIGLLANGHILIEGVPGLAKTLAVQCLAAGIKTGPREGVVLVDDVVVRKGNSEGFEPQFQQPLHQGVEFRVIEQRPGWLSIELPDGKTGWIRAADAGLI